jgi:hypothetical protein
MTPTASLLTPSLRCPPPQDQVPGPAEMGVDLGELLSAQ